MLILSEKKLRSVIREEFELFMAQPQSSLSTYSITSSAGGEIIMPSPIKEAFDEGKIKSIGDIL